MGKFLSSLYEGSELDNCDDSLFNSQIMAPSGGRGASSRHQKGVLMAHNWWSVECETAASSTT